MVRTSWRQMTATPVQTAAVAVSVVFLLVGLLGFVPGATTNAESLPFAGHASPALLFGIFQVSVLHNLVHLAFGIVGIVLARTSLGARTFLVVGGIVYLLFWLYGVLVHEASTANFVPFNTADQWLHFLLGAGMIVVGVTLGGRSGLGSIRRSRPFSRRGRRKIL